MGAGASVETLSPVARQACLEEFIKMKGDIETKLAEPENDESIARFLKECGETLAIVALKSAQVPPAGRLTHKPTQTGLAKGRMSKKPKGPTRRRSYGMKESKRFEEMARGEKNGQCIEVSASEPVLDTMEQLEAQNAEMAKKLEEMKVSNAEIAGAAPEGAETAVDSWDSVTQLPYCAVCQMAFKSISQLDRHTKYSSLHQKNIESAEKQAETDQKLKALDIRQEEGKDYALLYFGSKFFWRSQDNVDISFYQHIVLHCVEVVPYDVYKGKPLDRLYFDKFVVENLIEADVKKVVETKRAALAEKKKNDKFGDVIPFDEAEAYNNAQRMELTTFILSRLQLQSLAEGQGTKMKSKLVYTPLGNGADKAGPSPLLLDKPELLVPVQVTHRRNTSSAEVKAKLREVEESQQDLKSAITRCEKITKLVHTFISINSSDRYKGMSLPKKRFVMAARKIIQIKAVERTKKFLAEQEAKKLGLSPDGRPRRKRNSVLVRTEL